MKKHMKRALALVGVLTIVGSQTALAATYYGNYSKANMWKDVFYSEQARLYSGAKMTYGYTYSAWPGSKSDHYNGVMAAISYENTWDVAQVFGEDCMDLHFSSIESTKNYKDYFIDADRFLSPNDTAEWNGFLFAVVSGAKAVVDSKTTYFEYGSKETVTEYVAERTDYSEKDAYLYVFDIRDGKNYGEALVAKWNINEIVGSDKNTYTMFESVAVNDDYICLTVNNGSVSGDNSYYSYDRGVVVLENNIKRDGASPSPVRIDEADESYRYGVKPVIETAQNASILNTGTFDSTIIGDYLVIFPTVATNMTKANDKTIAGEEKIVLVNLSDVAQGGRVEKLSVVVSDIYKEDNRTASSSLNEILPLENGKSWHDITNAKIRGIKADGTEFSFLVTYEENENGKTTYYKHIFVTDWNDPERPKAVADFKYIDAPNTDTSGQYAINDDLFYYEGYYYIPSNYGVDVVKKYDESGKINPSFITTHLYANSDETKDWHAEGKKVDVFVSGNYMMAWHNRNSNGGYEIRLRLSDDKSEIVEYGGYGQRNRMRAINDCNDIIQYKDKVYLMSTDSIFATMNPCINVIDLAYAAPMSISVSGIPQDISLPYTISGSCTGLTKVAIYIDNEFAAYVDAQKTEDGTFEWKYTLTKAGNHSVKAVGVPFGTTEIEQTAEYAEYTGISAEEIAISGSYSANGDKLDASITVGNSGALDINGRVIVGIYKDDILYSLGISDTISVGAGKSEIVDNIDIDLPSYVTAYTVKAFLTSGSNGFAPLTSAAVLTEN